MSVQKAMKKQQSVEALEGKRQHLTTADLQAALGVASPATANSWADQYSRLSERPVRRNAREARVFEVWQIEEISQAYQLLATQVVTTRTEALTQVLAEQSKSTAKNRLTAVGSERLLSVDDAGGGSSSKSDCQIELNENQIEETRLHLELPVVLVAVAATDATLKPLPIKVHWGLFKIRVARARVYQWALQCFSFGHSPHWQRLNKAQRDVWIRRVGWFNNVCLFFATVALISMLIIKLLLWGLSFGMKVAPIPYEPVVWMVIVCAYVVPSVLFSLFPQG